MNVNRSAFGTNASELTITGGALIPEDFDWHCLADILKEISLSAAADFARQGDKDEVIRVLTAAMSSSQDISNLTTILKPRQNRTLDLSFAGERLRHFYHQKLTKQEVTCTRKRSASAAGMATYSSSV